MALLADDGSPIFPEFAPPDAGAPPVDAPPFPQENPNLVPPAAAAPLDADFAPTGAAADPIASTPDAVAPDPILPAQPDWDDPSHPYRQEAEQARQAAEIAYQQMAQQQQRDIAEAERQSQERQRALMQARLNLDARVGEFAPEDFQKHSLEINRRLAAELQSANASKQAIAGYYDQQQQQLVWDQSIVQASGAFGLTREEVNYCNQYAKDTQHLEQLARDFKSRRDEKAHVRNVTSELAAVKAEQQRLRSEAAAQRSASGADRSGGIGGSPVPTPAPTSPLGLLRLATTGSADAPLVPR